MSQQQNGIQEDDATIETANGHETPSDVDETLRYSGPEQFSVPEEQPPQQAATGHSQPVASQSVVAASSAAPVESAPTVAQLEENILRRLMDQLQQWEISNNNNNNRNRSHLQR